MVAGAINATGWPELIDGHMIGAAFVMYNTAFFGWAITILFFVYQIMLYMKTRNMTLCFITGIMFVSLFAFATVSYGGGSLWTYIARPACGVILLVLLFELGIIMYELFWKN